MGAQESREPNIKIVVLDSYILHSIQGKTGEDYMCIEQHGDKNLIGIRIVYHKHALKVEIVRTNGSFRLYIDSKKLGKYESFIKTGDVVLADLKSVKIKSVHDVSEGFGSLQWLREKGVDVDVMFPVNREKKDV